MKKMLYVVTLILLFTLFACYSDPVESEVPTDPNLTPDPTEVDPTEDNLIYLTLEQLSEFDGREGRKAYVAVNGYNTTGLIAFILFIPLVITSLMIVRKKMKPIHWKRLHKLSYITYLLIYIHIGFNIYFRDPFYFAVKPNVWLFHLLPILYIILRLVNIIIPKYKQRAAT